MSFDKLIDLFVEFIGLFQFWTYIDEYEAGVVLRFGRYNRTIGPGWRWLWPLGVERHMVENVKPDTMMLGIQSLHTSDDYAINIQYSIQWEVFDVRAFLLDVEGGREAITDVAADHVSDFVQVNKWKDVSHPNFKKALKAPINRQIKKWGARVLWVRQHDCSASEAKRYWHEGIEIQA